MMWRLFYVCVKFTPICESWSTVPRGPPRLTNKHKISLISNGLSKILVFSAISPCWSDVRVTIAPLSRRTLEHLKRSEK